MAAPMITPASRTRQLSCTIGIRPTYRAVRIQPAAPSTSSVKTVAQLAPWYPKSGMSTRLSARLATTLQPSAHVKADRRPDAFRGPVNAVLADTLTTGTASNLAAGAEPREAR